VAGSGDGWDMEFYNGNIYNVWHHKGTTTVDCHVKATGVTCTGYPKTVVDTVTTHNFATSPRPSLELDRTTGTMYLWATDASTETAGVVSFDLDSPDANPFVAFVPLSAVGEAEIYFSQSYVSQGVRIGDKWYSYNSIRNGTNVTPTGTVGKIMCFDFVTGAACDGQPYALPGMTAMWGRYHAPMMSPIGTRIIVSNYEGDPDIGMHYCFDTAINGTCTGSWPHASFGHDLSTGYVIPALDASGNQIGLCFRDPDWTFSGQAGTTTCVDGEGVVLTDASTALSAGINESAAHPDAGERFVLGTRVYLAAGNTFYANLNYFSMLECFDWATELPCPNFPVMFNSFADLDALYNVNSDPANPGCLWLMAHGGSKRLSNLDAYTGGVCGEGGSRVQLNAFVQSAARCVPTQFTSLTVVSPLPAAYTGGTITFSDVNAAPIGTLPVQNIDASGLVDLRSLNITTASGLPQLQVDLPGAETEDITLKIEWTGPYHDECDNGGQTVTYNQLPETGTDTGPLLAAAVALIGTGLVLTFKRRRSTI